MSPAIAYVLSESINNAAWAYMVAHSVPYITIPAAVVGIVGMILHTIKWELKHTRGEK